MNPILAVQRSTWLAPGAACHGPSPALGVVLLALSAVLTACASAPDAAAPIRPFVGFWPGVRYTSSPGDVVPSKEMRLVPIHPDDTGDNGRIKDSALKIPGFVEFEVARAGVKVDVAKGVRLDAFFSSFLRDGQPDLDPSDTNERNYTNAPGTSRRGQGAALTYVGVTQSSTVVPAINADVHFGNAKEGGDVFAGIGLRRYDFEVQNGWDRYDSLEVHSRTNGGSVLEKSVHIGFETRVGGAPFGSSKNNDIILSIRAGALFNDVSGEKGVRATGTTGFFASIGLGTDF